jgi:hypothetical protein
MKKRILTMLAALVLAGAFIELSPTILKDSGLAWINWESLTGRHGFYFKRRQWLADLRTVVAAFRFLYESYPAGSTGLTSAADAPELLPPKIEISTNLLGLEGNDLPSMFAFAEFSSNELYELRCSPSCVTGPGQSLFLRLAPRDLVTPSKLQNSHADIIATNLQGA